MSVKVKYVFGFIVLLLVLQFFPVDRTNGENVNEIKAPENVKVILKKACYDCHSNLTVWPKYSYVFPLSVIIAHHVHEGREELNFSIWETYSPKKQVRKASEINEAIGDGEMPVFGYTFTHPEAVLSDAEKDILMNWEDSVAAKFNLPKGKGEDEEK